MNIRKLTLLVLIGLQGCTMGIERMQARLPDQLRESRGLSMHEARLETGIIGQRDPTEVRMLANGHVLYIYRDYWLAEGITAMPCDVFLEVKPKGQVIAKGYASGSGCN